MNDDILVKVDNVSKKFCRSLKRSLFYGVQDIASKIIGKIFEFRFSSCDFRFENVAINVSDKLQITYRKSSNRELIIQHL